MSDVQTAIEYELLKGHPKATHITVAINRRSYDAGTMLSGAAQYEVHFAESMQFKVLYFWVDCTTNEVVAISRYSTGG